jgi:DNA-binding Xre family transcriptional regulator
MIENKIKQIIIEKYGSVKRFSDKIGIPYTTIDTILKRGLKNSNVLNVLKMCNELNLDINELANNKIVIKESQ